MSDRKKNAGGAEDFVRAVESGDNVKAKEKLEEILKVKVARRIKDTLAS